MYDYYIIEEFRRRERERRRRERRPATLEIPVEEPCLHRADEEREPTPSDRGVAIVDFRIDFKTRP